MPAGRPRRMKMAAGAAILRGGRPERRGRAWLVPRARLKRGPGCPEAPPTVAPPGEARTAHAGKWGRPRSAVPQEGPVDVIDGRCRGPGIHKRTVVAGLLVPAPGGPPRQEVRAFGAMTEDTLALGGWLAAAGCRHGAGGRPGGL